MKELTKVFGDTPINVEKINEELFFDISGIAKRYKKQFSHWENLESTKEYLRLLKDTYELQLSKTILKIGNDVKIHRRLLVKFARWINPKFELWCDEIIYSIAIGEKELINNQLIMKDTQLRNAQKQLNEISKNGMKTYRDGFMSLRKYLKDREIDIKEDLAIEKLLENNIVEYKEVFVNKQQLIDNNFGFQESESVGIKFNPRALDEIFYTAMPSLFDE